MPQRTPSTSPIKHFKSPCRSKKSRIYGVEELRNHRDRFDKNIDDRNYPRRDVVHFESPPRRRLRETEDEAVQVYH
jgi:hypothetical protein